MPDENEQRKVSDVRGEVEGQVGYMPAEEHIREKEREIAEAMDRGMKAAGYERVEDLDDRMTASEAKQLQEEYAARAEGVLKKAGVYDPYHDIDNWFRYHRPTGNQAARYEGIREAGRQMAISIVAMAPDTRERTVAIRRIREAVMYANAAIACNEGRS